MEIFNVNSLPPWVIKPIYGLHAKDEHGREVQDEQQHQDDEYAHPGGPAKVPFTVVGGAKHRSVGITRNVQYSVWLYLCAEDRREGSI